MGNRTVISALKDVYRPGIEDAIHRDNSLPQRELRGLEDALEKLARELSADPDLARSVIEGEADPNAVYLRYRQLLGNRDRSIQTMAPLAPAVRRYAIPSVQIVSGACAALGRYARESDAALGTTSPWEDGLPMLPEYVRIFRGGRPDGMVGRHALAGGLTLFVTTPYTVEVRDRDGVVVMREDLRDEFVRAVTGITGEEAFRETYWKFFGRFLKSIERAQRSISSIMERSAQTRRVIPSDRVMPETLAAVQARLIPLDMEAGVAHQAFVVRTPLGQTPAGRLVAIQVRAITQRMMPVMYSVLSGQQDDHGIPPSSRDPVMSHKHLASLVRGGLKTFSDPLSQMGIYEQRMPLEGLPIAVDRGSAPFTSFASLPLQRVLDEIIYWALRDAPNGLRFSFDGERGLIIADYDLPQPPAFGRRLEGVASRWQFEGQIGFDKESGGIRTVIISRESARPDDNGDTLRPGPHGEAPPSIHRAFTAETIPAEAMAQHDVGVDAEAEAAHAVESGFYTEPAATTALVPMTFLIGQTVRSGK